MGKNGTILTFGVTGFRTTLMLVTSVVLARYLGPEGRGILMAFIFWPSLVLGVFFLSLNETTMYHLAKARAGNSTTPKSDTNKEKRDETAGAAFFLHLVAALILPFIAVYILPFITGRQLVSHMSLLQLFAAIFVPLTVLDLCFNAILQGRGNARHFNLLRLIQPIVYTLGLVILAFQDMLGLQAVLVVMLLAGGISVIVGYVLAGFPRPSWNRSIFSRLLGTSKRIHGANLLLYISAEIDKLVVLTWMDATSAGIYAVALAVSLVGSQIVTQSFTILAYARISSTPEGPEQVALLCTVAQISFWLLVLGNSIVAFISPWLFPVVFGADFAASVPIAMVLLLVTTLKGTRQVLDRALRAMMNIRLAVLSEAIGLACFVGLAPIGIMLGGLIGIAWAMAGAQLIALAVILAGITRDYDISVRDLLGLRIKTAHFFLAQMKFGLSSLHRKKTR